MKFFKLNRNFNLIKQKILLSHKKILENQNFILGNEVNKLEKILSRFVGSATIWKNCLSCGTVVWICLSYLEGNHLSLLMSRYAFHLDLDSNFIWIPKRFSASLELFLIGTVTYFL